MKKRFLSILESSPDTLLNLLGLRLKTVKWKTHIGRGTFTNLISDNAKNPYDIASMRGDNSIESALTYLANSVRVHNKLTDSVNNMYTEYLAETGSDKEEQ